MNYNIYIFIPLFLLFANITAANKNFHRLLPKTVSLEIQHPDSKVFSIGITNSLNKNILFKNCNFDCECLEIISLSKNEKKCREKNVNLEPKDVLNIKFKIDSKFYTKPKILPVYFYFNYIVPAVQIVKINADFKSDIISNPESLACIVPQGLKGKIGSFALNFDNKNIKIGAVKSNVDFINPKFIPENNAIDVYVEKPINVNTDAWLQVHIPPLKGVPEGRGMSSRRKQKNLFLHIREIKIIPDIYAEPSTMDFGVISKPGEIIGKEVVLKSRTDTPWKIIGSQIKGRNANSVKRKALPQTNATVNVLWAILDGKVLPGLIDTEIIINTDHPYIKQIIVPIKGQILAPKNVTQISDLKKKAKK